MKDRAEVIAFQMVHNRGYNESLDSIRNQIDFYMMDIPFHDLRKSIEDGIDLSKVNMDEVMLYRHAIKHISFLKSIEFEIKKHRPS